MKTDLYKLEDIVKDVLENFEDTRSDDFVLIYRVYKEINEEAVIRELFFEVMLNHQLYNLPHFESVTRCRRKVQNKYPELSNEKTNKKRMNATTDYINYAIDGYNPTIRKMINYIK